MLYFSKATLIVQMLFLQFSHKMPNEMLYVGPIMEDVETKGLVKFYQQNLTTNQAQSLAMLKYNTPFSQPLERSNHAFAITSLLSCYWGSFIVSFRVGRDNFFGKSKEIFSSIYFCERQSEGSIFCDACSTYIHSSQEVQSLYYQRTTIPKWIYASYLILCREAQRITAIMFCCKDDKVNTPIKWKQWMCLAYCSWNTSSGIMAYCAASLHRNKNAISRMLLGLVSKTQKQFREQEEKKSDLVTYFRLVSLMEQLFQGPIWLPLKELKHNLFHFSTVHSSSFHV